MKETPNSYFCLNPKNQEVHESTLHSPDTAWKVSVFGVFLVRILPHLDWICISPYSVQMRKIRTRRIPNTNTFHTVWKFQKILPQTHFSLTENSHFIFRNIQLKKHIHSFTLSLKTIFWKDCEFPLKYLLLLWLSTYTQEKSLSYHHLVLTYCWFSIGSSLWHTQASPNTSIGMD